MSEAQETAPPQTLLERWLINRNFALMWTGDVISALGDYSFTITLAIWVGLVLAKGQPWAPLAVAALVLSATLPPIFIGPLAGVYVDRWDRRQTLIITNAIQAGLVGILVLTTFLPGGHLPLGWQLALIFIVNFALISADQFYNQAGFPLIMDIVKPEDFSKAISRVLLFVSIGTIVGPAIGAPLIVAFGPRWALLINAMSFLVSLALLVPLQAPPYVPTPKPQSETGFWPEFKAGLTFVLESPVLRTMVIALILETVGTNAIPAVNIFFATQTLHMTTALFGLLATALGLGVLVGSSVSTQLVKRFGAETIFWVSLAADGVLLVIYSRLTAPAPALFTFFLLGIPTGTVNVAMGPLIMRATPNELMGRTSAVRVSLISTAGVVGTVLAGLLVSTLFRGTHAHVLGMTFRSYDIVIFLAGLIALFSGLYAMRVFAAEKQEASEKPMVEPVVVADKA